MRRRQQGRVAEVQNVGVRGYDVASSHRDDAVAFDEHGGVSQRLVAPSVDQAVGKQRDLAGRRAFVGRRWLQDPQAEKAEGRDPLPCASHPMTLLSWAPSPAALLDRPGDRL